MERPNSDFVFSENFAVTDEVKKAFDTNGYIILRSLLKKDELSKLKEALEHDKGIMEHSYGRDDGEGGTVKVCLWNQPRDDITGIIARSEKMAGTFEQLLGGEVYHYHSKVIMKGARTGGAHVWHQDYGYWYSYGCIFPNMGTAWLAIDKAEQKNGCLKILVGSNKVGRIDHVKIGDQVGADLERLAQVEKFCPLLHVECEPGDCLFFHCNILHRSDQNHSDNRRWAFLVSYNRADNNPVYKHHHPFYTPLNKVPNDAIGQCSVETTTNGKDFFHGLRQTFKPPADSEETRPR